MTVLLGMYHEVLCTVSGLGVRLCERLEWNKLISFPPNFLQCSRDPTFQQTIEQWLCF